MQKRLLKNPKVELIWDSVVDEAVGDVALRGVRVRNLKTGHSHIVHCGGVFYAIGHEPKTSFLERQLDLDETGYIFYVVYQLVRGTSDRARLALFAVSIMEVYGALIYFGAEALGGFADLDTTSFARTWVLFVGLNSLWLIFPGWCIFGLLAPPVRASRASSRRHPAQRTAVAR
jgi:hypothetical protein